MITLNDKKILISGVGKGIGKSMLFHCLKQGAFVVGFTKSQKDITDIKKKNFTNLILFKGDVSDQKFINYLFKYLKKRNIKLNGLINNAGIRQRKSFLKINEKDLFEILKINFFSVFQISQKFINQTNKKISSSIVNVGSIVGPIGFSELTGYASTKSALNGLTKSLSTELKSKNYKVRVNCINPGFTKSSYFENFKKKRKLYSWTLKNIPVKRWGEPEEISELASFLLSDNSSNISGQCINIDGGWTK